jgi:hypothetical protein
MLRELLAEDARAGAALIVGAIERVVGEMGPLCA